MRRGELFEGAHIRRRKLWLDRPDRWINDKFLNSGRKRCVRCRYFERLPPAASELCDDSRYSFCPQLDLAGAKPKCCGEPELNVNGCVTEPWIGVLALVCKLAR